MAQKSSPNAIQAWTSGIVINLVSSVIALAIGALVAYFEHRGSAWVKPILFGMVGWLLTFSAFAMVRWTRSLPAKVELVSHENVERFVRLWLDNYGQTVQKTPNAEDHFRYLVTTTGGKKITIKHRHDFPEYLTFTALMTFTEEQKKLAQGLSQDDQNRAIIDLRLEFIHALVGLDVNVSFLEGITAFIEIPITRTLSQSEFIKTLWRIEAVINAFLAVNGLTEIRLRAEGKLPAAKVEQVDGSL
jgi:hypothetical protein